MLFRSLIDLHADLNRLPQRERSSCWRAARDGEVFTRHFPQHDGTTVVRFVLPEQVRDPGNLGPCASLGVEIEDGDVETVLAYHTTYDGASYERVLASDVCHLKRNVDEEIKRGLSDFYSAGETFDDVAKLLRNMRRGGAVLAAIAWIEEFESTTRDQMTAHQGAQRDLGRPQFEDPITGRQNDQQTLRPGTVVRTQKGKKYLPPPLAGNTTNFTAIVQAALRACGTRWGFPEYFISGDASNNAYSSILVAGSPLVSGIETDQDDFGQFFLRWRWIAIRNACAHGLIRATFEEVMTLVDLHFTPPQVVVADEQAQASVDSQDMQAKVLSKRTRASRRGLDYEQEKKNLEEEKAEEPEQGGGQEGEPPPGDEQPPPDEQEDGQPPAAENQFARMVGESLSLRDFIIEELDGMGVACDRGLL